MKGEFVTVIIPRLILRVPIERISSDMPHDLTPMERKVFAHLTSGKINKEIGAAMNLSIQSIKNHATHIYRKAGVSTRLEFLARYGKVEK